MPSESSICAAIAKSSLFDAKWYLEQNPDVALSGIDPVLHYVRNGEKEGRAASKDFCATGRLAVPGSSGNLLYDYLIGARNFSVRKNIPVIFVTNDNYAPLLGVALTSLILNCSPNYCYKIFVLYDKFSSTNLQKLSMFSAENIEMTFIDISNITAEFKNSWSVTGHLSEECYYRLFIPQIITDYSKCLYLDCDVIINVDIAKLYEEDISSFYFGAVIDNWEEQQWLQNLRKFNPGLHQYFNDGILVMNLEKFRNSNLRARIGELLLSGKKFPGHEQDILNIVCNGNIRELPATWNCMWQFMAKEGYKFASRKTCASFFEAFAKPSIVHFNSDIKPWHKNDGYFAPMFWNYAKRSPYFSNLSALCAYPLQDKPTARESELC